MRYYLLIIWVICLSHDLKAEPQKPETLTFSYVRHPVILNKLIPIVKETYARIGIEIVLVAQPSSRNLKLVSSGLVDGDVAFTASLAEAHDNVVIISPRLSRGKYVLLCHAAKNCNEGVLFDENQSLVVTDTSFDSLKTAYQDRLKAKFYPINRVEHIPSLISEKRFEYGIYILNINTVESPFPDAQYFHTLYQTNTVHVLNAKYLFLKDMVSASLSEVLAEANSNALNTKLPIQ